MGDELIHHIIIKIVLAFLLFELWIRRTRTSTGVGFWAGAILLQALSDVLEIFCVGCVHWGLCGIFRILSVWFLLLGFESVFKLKHRIQIPLTLTAITVLIVLLFSATPQNLSILLEAVILLPQFFLYLLIIRVLYKRIPANVRIVHDIIPIVIMMLTMVTILQFVYHCYMLWHPLQNRLDVIPKTIHLANEILDIVLVVSMVTMIYRISERKREVEHQILEERENHLQSMITNAPTGIALLGSGYKFFEVNEKFCKMTGYSHQELLDMDFRKLIAQDSMDLVLSHYRRKTEGNEDSVSYEMNIVRNDRKIRTLQMNSSRYMTVSGETRVVAQMIDITEAKQQRDEIMLYSGHLEEMVEQRTEELRQSEKLALLGTILSGTAHELGNPLNYVTLNSNVLKQLIDGMEDQGNYQYRFTVAIPDAKQSLLKSVNGIEEGCSRLKRIVQDLKQYASPEQTSSFSMVHIPVVLDSALNILNAEICKADVHVRIQKITDMPVIDGSFQKIEQVFINLIHNAILAMTGDVRRLTILMRHSNDRIELLFEDSGCGIEPENISQLDTPFYTSRRSQGGTGLGLSIVKRIITEHRGAIHFRSTPGKGTSVAVVLPINQFTREETV